MGLRGEVLAANEMGLDDMTVGGQILEQAAQAKEAKSTSGIV